MKWLKQFPRTPADLKAVLREALECVDATAQAKLDQIKNFKEAMLSFTIGDTVEVLRGVLEGQKGTIIKFRNIYVVVEVAGQKWKVQPTALKKVTP